VRNLSKRCAEAADQANDLIAQSRGGTDQGVSAARQAAEILARIDEAASSASETSGLLARLATAQGEKSRRLCRHIDQAWDRSRKNLKLARIADANIRPLRGYLADIGRLAAQLRSHSRDSAGWKIIKPLLSRFWSSPTE